MASKTDAATSGSQQKKPFFVPGIQRRLNALLREVQHEKDVRHMRWEHNRGAYD